MSILLAFTTAMAQSWLMFKPTVGPSPFLQSCSPAAQSPCAHPGNLGSSAFIMYTAALGYSVFLPINRIIECLGLGGTSKTIQFQTRAMGKDIFH